MDRIEADLLIPGKGDPVRDGAVIIDGPRIRYAGPAQAAPETPGAVRHQVTAVLPGLWDCHGHLFGVRSFDINMVALEHVAVRSARCTHDLRAALDARHHLGPRGERARRVPGPRRRGGDDRGSGDLRGRIGLGITWGHADLHSLPLPWVEEHARLVGDGRLADGAAECMRATREQLRRNAKVIKVCASGGVLSEVDDPIH